MAPLALALQRAERLGRPDTARRERADSERAALALAVARGELVEREAVRESARLVFGAALAVLRRTVERVRVDPAVAGAGADVAGAVEDALRSAWSEIRSRVKRINREAASD